MWPRAKMKFVARLAYGDSLQNDNSQDGTFRVFGSNGPFTSFSRSNTRAPTIIIGRKGSYGKVNWVAEPCFASDTTFFIDESTSRNYLRWLYWLLQTLRLDEGTDEAAVPGLNRETVYSKDVLVPPLPKQRAIADFLDRETARLDALIAAKEKVLALLAEKRRAFVTRAITRGLHSHVKLRESGISWLGKIPTHWTVKRLKFVVSGIDQGSSPQCFDIPAGPGSLGVLKAGCVNGGRFREQENKTLPPEMDADLTHLISHGDILMSRASGSADLVGSVAMVEQEPTTKLLLSDKIFRLRIDPTKTSGRYLVLSMGTALFRLQIASIISGAEGLPNNVAKSDVLELSIAVPPLEEQRAIAAHLDNETATLNALGKRTGDTILLLNERRSALIAAAVTGRIDIRATS